MSSLGRLLLGAGLLFGAFAAWAAERVLELSVDEHDAGIVLLYESDHGLLIKPEDLPEEALSDTARQALPSVSTDSCRGCWRVVDIGHFQENPRQGTASLSVRPQWLPLRNIQLYKPREASARHLQRDVSFITNFSFSVRDARDAHTAGLGIAESRLSLGPLGVLEGGVRHSVREDFQDTVRLPVRLVNHFIDQQVSYELGEISTDADPAEGGVGIAGFRLYRNFATRPDLTQRPLYDFFTQLERPSVVELYVDTRRVRREEFDSPGPVQLSDFRPSGSGKVLLLITDSLGTRRVVETDLIADGRALGQGVVDFSLSGGSLRVGEQRDDQAEAAAFRISVGATNRLNLGLLGEGARYDPLSPNFTGREEIWNAGATVLWDTPLGQFDLVGKYGEDDLGEHFTSSRGSWRKIGRIGDLHYSLGAEGFEDKDFVTIGGRERSLRGGRGFAGMTYRKVYLSGSYFDINDEEGYGIGVGFRHRGLAIDAAVDVVEDADPLYTLSFGYSFGTRASARIGARKAESADPVESFISARGRGFDSTLNWRAEAFHNDASHRNRGNLGANWTPGFLSAGYEARFFGEDQYEHFGDMSIGTAISKKGAIYVGRRITEREGIALVDTELPHVGFAVDGRQSTSNWRGLGVLPVIGFGRHFATIDTSSLPASNLVHQTRMEVSTVPGQASFAHFTLNAPSALIKVIGTTEGDILTVNGQDIRIYHFGAFAENLVLGENTLVYNGRTYRLVIDNFDESLPTIELQEGWFK